MADYKKGDTASWDAQQVRRSSSSNQRNQTSGQKQTKKRKRGQRTNPVLYVLFVLLTSAILAGVGWLLMTDLCAFNNEYRTVTVEVTSEDTVKTIAKKLEDAELIEYKWFFRLFALVANADEKIGIGTYELNTDMDYRALITGMQNSSGNMNADTVRVTIPEGFTVEQTIALMAEKGVNTKERTGRRPDTQGSAETVRLQAGQCSAGQVAKMLRLTEEVGFVGCDGIDDIGSLRRIGRGLK